MERLFFIVKIRKYGLQRNTNYLSNLYLGALLVSQSLPSGVWTQEYIWWSDTSSGHLVQVQAFRASRRGGKEQHGDRCRAPGASEDTALTQRDLYKSKAKDRTSGLTNMEILHRSWNFTVSCKWWGLESRSTTSPIQSECFHGLEEHLVKSQRRETDGLVVSMDGTEK